MDENTVLQDILSRLTDMTDSLMEINRDMLRRPEFSAEKERIYARIGAVQTETIKILKDALQIIDSKIVLIEGRQQMLEAQQTKWRVPGWLISLISGGAALAGQQGLKLAEQALSLHNR